MNVCVVTLQIEMHIFVLLFKSQINYRKQKLSEIQMIQHKKKDISRDRMSFVDHC